MKDTIKFTMKTAIILLVIVAALFFIGSENVVGMFIGDASVIAYGSRFLRGYCLGLPFLAVDFMAVGVFQAVGMGKEALLFAILRKVALEIPALFILNWLMPLYGLAYAQFTAEVILAIAAVLVLKRLFKRIEKGTQKF